MYPEDLDLIASVGTMCNSTVTQQGSDISVKRTESSVWELSLVGE